MTAWWPKSRAGAGRSSRKPAAPVVHSASLDGPAAVRQRRAKRSWLRAYCSLGRNTRGAHSLDCSMSCAKRHAVMLSRTLRQVSDLSMLFCRSTAPHLAAFYLAIARSAVCAPPILRGPSPNCDQTKTRSRISAAHSVQVRCSRHADSLVYERASCVAGSTEAGTRELRRLCPLFAERAQEGGGKQTGLSRTWCGNVRCCG
jgi:hypothetical protein